jgi:membrane-bound lytic murein transglycosylase A
MPAHLSRARFADLAGWDKAKPAAAVETFRRSCLSIPRPRDRWADACSAAVPVPKDDQDAARQFFERWFDVYRVRNGDSDEGLFTGYYEAEIEASRKRTKDYRYPIFARPRHGAHHLSRRVIENCADDWVRSLERRRRPSRSRACRIVRSWSVLFWAKDRIDLFITEIQGSARVRLTDGTTTRIGYAGQNGHPYVAVGKLLIDRDVFDAKDMSMQAIRAWMRKHPRDGRKLMHQNPSFVFFKERRKNRDEIGPRGALDVPLTPGRSVAVDPRYIPLGAPLWIETTWPKVPDEDEPDAGRKAATAGPTPRPRPPEDDEPRPLRRLLIAQDTGGVIRGPVRGDLYWGTGDAALRTAGVMNQKGRWFLLLPKGYYGRPAALPLPPRGEEPGTTPPPARSRHTFRIWPKWLRL